MSVVSPIHAAVRCRLLSLMKIVLYTGLVHGLRSARYVVGSYAGKYVSNN